MANLANMFAKATENKSDATSAATDSIDVAKGSDDRSADVARSGSPDEGAASHGASKPSLAGPVSSSSPVAAPSAAKSANPFAPRQSSVSTGRGSESGSVAAMGGQATGGTAGGESKLNDTFNSVGLEHTGSNSGESVVESIGGIGDLNRLLAQADLDAVESTRTMSHFADELAATKPNREVPADMDLGEVNFVELIDQVYNILDDSELLGGVLRNIMIELQSNKQYMRMVHDDDIRTWVRAMRRSMGLAIVKKSESKAKRGTSAKSKQPKADMLAALNSLGIQGDFD